MRALLCTAALTIACAWAPAVFAQDAAALFREGSASFARGDYRAAALAFDAAYRRDPQGATAYNAALAWDATKEAGDQAPAADGYDAAIERGGIEASELEHAKVRLAKLEQVLGRVDVSGPEGARASLAHARDVPLPARIHALPGSYQIRVVFVGDRIETREITLTAGAPLAVTFAEPVETKTAPPVPLRPKPRRVRVETE
ncbi:MAG TPA: hypothetical protein VFB62_26445, partial [Polyangiaceae bacterium]|nr:hypothetical protein [Polyangiaceae bacterium]